MHEGSPRWRALENELRELPENHRRVVVALLEVFIRDLRELLRAGMVAATAKDLENLEALWVSLRGGPSSRNLEAMKALMEVQLEELEPRRLAGYGPLTPEHEKSLRGLVAWLRALLADSET